MVVLGRANSRMKDYYDVWMILRTLELDPGRMQRAIAATFARRDTMIPVVAPDGLGDAFAVDRGKQRQWEAFACNLSGPAPDFGVIVRDLRFWLMVHLTPD
jgi:hypothetical protein